MPVIPLIVDDSQAEKVEAARIAGARKMERGVLQVGEAWKTVSAASRDGLVGMTAQIKAFNAETRGMLKSLDAIQRQLKASEGASKQAANGVRTHGRASLDAGDKAAGYAKRLEIANRLIQKHGIESGVAKKIVASFGSNLDRADRQALGYATRLDQAQKSALAFAAAQKKAAADVRSVAAAEKKAAADTARLAAQQDKAAATAARQAAATRGLVGRLVGLAVAYGGVRVAARAIGGSSVEFGAVETALVSVSKTTDIVGADLRGLNDDVTEFATGPVPILKTELLAVGAAAGQVGVEGRENIAEQIELFGKLSAATKDIDADEAVVELARLRNVQGESAAATRTQVNVLVELGNKMEANESQIIKHASEVGRQTSEFRIGSVEALAFGAALAAIGTRAEGGGAAIGRTFREINKAVAVGGADLQGFADIAQVSAQDFADAWRDDPVEAIGLFLQGLKRFGTDASIALEGVGLGTDEIAKVLPVLALNFEVLADSQELARTQAGKLNALNEEASAVFNTQDSDVSRLINTYKLLQETIGGEMSPAVREMSAEWAAFIEGVDAEALGRSLANALKLASDGALFLAENADILKAAFLALLTIQIGSFLSGLAAKHLAAAAAAATQAVAVNGLTAAQARFLSVGLTPMTVGLAAVLGAVLLANEAIKDLSRTYEKEMADMVKATNAFADSQKQLGVDTDAIISRGDLQEMSDALGIQTNMLEEARTKAAGFEAEMDRLARSEKRAAEQGNLHGRFLEDLTSKQEAASLSFNKANTEVGNLEKGTDNLKDALRKWTPEVEKAGGAADDFGEEIKTVTGAMEKLQAQAVRQQSVALAMNTLEVSAGEAAQIVGTLTDMQVEAGIEGLAAADAVAEMLATGDDTAIGFVTSMVTSLTEVKSLAEQVVEHMEKIGAIRGRFDGLGGDIKPLPVRSGAPNVGDVGADFDASTAGTGGPMSRAVDKLISTLEDLGVNMDNLAGGLFSIGDQLTASGEGLAGAVVSAAGVFVQTRDAGQAFGTFITAAAGSSGFGVQQTSQFGGATEGNFFVEGTTQGAQIAGVWGAIIGGVVGSFINKGADDLEGMLTEVAGKADFKITLADEGLADLGNAIETALENSLNNLQSMLVADLDFAGLNASIDVRGNEFVVLVGTVRKTFNSVDEALAFFIERVLAMNVLTAGLSEEMQNLAGAANGLQSASIEELNKGIQLALALDFEETGVRQDAIRAQELEIQTAIRFGLTVEKVIALQRKRIETERRGLQAQAAGILGATDWTSGILELTRNMEIFNATSDASVEAQRRRVTTLESLLAAQEGMTQELDAAASTTSGTSLTAEQMEQFAHLFETAGEEWTGTQEQINAALVDSIDQSADYRRELELLNEELAKPPAVKFSPEEFAALWTAAVGAASLSMIDMIRMVEGQNAFVKEEAAIRRALFVLQLVAAIAQGEILLATMGAVSEGMEVILGAVVERLKGTLGKVVAGDPIDFTGGGRTRGGGGRKEARESVRDFFDDLRQEAAQTAPGVLALGDRLEEFRDQMAEARRLSALTGEEMSQAWKDFLTVGARVANEGVKGALDAVAGIGDFQAALRDSTAAFADSRAQLNELIRVAEAQGLATEDLIAQREALTAAEELAGKRLVASKLVPELAAFGLALDPRTLRKMTEVELELQRARAINSVLAAQELGLIEDATELLDKLASADPLSEIAGQFDNLGDLMLSMKDDLTQSISGIMDSFDGLRENAEELEASTRRLKIIERERFEALMDLAMASQAAVAGDLAAADGIGAVGAAMDASTARFDQAEKEMRQVMAAIAATGKSTEELADQIGKLDNAERVTADGLAGQLIGEIQALGIVLPVEMTQRLAAAQTSLAQAEFLAALASEKFAEALTRQGVNVADLIKLVIAGPQPGEAGGARGRARGAGRSASARSGEDLEALRRDVLALMEGFRQMRLGPVASQAANLAQQLKDVMDKAKRTSIELGAVADAFDVARQAFIKTSLGTIGPPPDFNETANALTELEETFVDVLAGFMIIGASAEDMADAGERFALAAAEIELSAKEGIRGRIKDLEHLNTTQTNLDVFVGAKDRFEALAATALDMTLTNEERADALAELAGASTDFENEIKAFLGAGPTSQALLDEMLLTLKEVNAANILVVTDRDILEAQAASLAEIELTTAAQPTAASSASSFSSLGTSIDDSLQTLGGGLIDPVLLEELIAAFENEGLTVTELSALITQIGAVPFAEMTAALADSPIAVAEEVAKITAALGADAFADVVDALGGLGFADLVIALDDAGLDFVGFADELAGIDLTGLSFDEITDALGPFGPIAELLGPELFNKLVLALAPVTTGTGTTATALTTESGLLVNKMNSVRLNTNAEGPLHKRLGKGNDRTGAGVGDLSVQGHLAALNASLDIPGFEAGGFMPSSGLAFLHQNERILNAADTAAFDAGAFVTPVPVPVSAPRSDDSDTAAELREVKATLKKLAEQLATQFVAETTNQGAMIEELIEGNVTADKIAASTGAKASKVETSRDRAP